MKNKKIYLNYIVYTASGEGTLIELSVVYAKNKKEAKSKHKWILGTDDYYMIDIDSFDISKDKVEVLDILKYYFNNEKVESMLNLIKDGLQEFQFRFKFNLS